MLSAPSPQPSVSTAVEQNIARPPRTWTAALPLVLVALVYLIASVGPAMFDQNEAQYAGAVREMLDRPQDYQTAARFQLERGHWYIPTNDGIPRLQKPPLVYWMLMGSMQIFGVNEFGARLPNALVTLLWFWATFLVGRRVAGKAFGIAGTTILATMFGTFLFTHIVAPEPYLAAFLTLTFWCFLSACQQTGRAAHWMFLAWVFMGLGVISKGLHGALYPLSIAMLLAWRHAETRPVWKKLLQPAGIGVFLAIVAPWYAVMAVRYPGFLHEQFINEQWGHVINQRTPPDSDRVPLLVFWLEHLVFFLPWTFFIPAAISVPRSTARRRNVDTLKTDLLVCWFAVVAVSVLFSSLQDYYLVTAWAPVAFWFARPWTTTDRDGSPAKWSHLFPGVCLTAVGLVVLAAAIFLQMHTTMVDAGKLAAPTALRDTMAATLMGFSAAVWCQLLPLVWTAGAFFLLGGLTSLYLAWRGRWLAVLPATAVMMSGVLLLSFGGLHVLEDYFSLKRIALTANRVAGPTGLVVCSGVPEDNPSLLFYLDREIYWVHANPASTFATRALGIGQKLFLTPGDLVRQWNSPRTVLLITEAGDAAQWQSELGLTSTQIQPITQSGTRILLANHDPVR